jgi:ferric iron reductase protein FhuF
MKEITKEQAINLMQDNFVVEELNKGIPEHYYLSSCDEYKSSNNLNLFRFNKIVNTKEEVYGNI